jgi:integrase
MGRKTQTCLIRRGRIWHIQKRIGGKRVRRSTGTDSLQEAEMILARVIEEERKAAMFGVRPTRTFAEAAARFVLEHEHKRSLDDDIGRLRNLMPVLGDIALDKIHMGTLAPWIEARRQAGRAPGTINHGLQLVRRILRLAASRWRDADGLTWLETPAEIVFVPNHDKRQPYPLTWDEQDRLFGELPDHLAAMARFTVNTGCRDGEVCALRWAWEVEVPELGASVFLIPAARVKNGLDRLAVLNREAARVVEAQRGRHPSHVFTHRGKPVTRMLNHAWLKARRRAGLPEVRVHDLKHTFGRRLRAAGVSFEDRQDLLGHKSQRVTTHYSAADLGRLVAAANRVCGDAAERPALVVLRRAPDAVGHKTNTDTRRAWRENGRKSLRTLVAEEGLEPPTRGL